MHLHHKGMSRTPNKRIASDEIDPRPSVVPRTGSPFRVDNSSGLVDGSRHLSDLHLAAATASKLANGDESDDDEDLTMSEEHIRSLTNPAKSSTVGGRKSGSKNYAASEHKHFLFLIDRLQAWAEGPTGEGWSEICERQYRKLGYRREPTVLHDHFMEMVNVCRTIMRENGLTFPALPEDTNLGEAAMNEQIELSYIELGEQLYLALQNRQGKKMCPAAWWDADVFAGIARIAFDMEHNNATGVQDATLMVSGAGIASHLADVICVFKQEQRRKEIDFEEKSTEGSAGQSGRQSFLSEARRSVSSAAVGGLPSIPAASSLKDDLAEIKQSSKLLRKFDERLTKVEEKIDMILKHLGVPNT